MEEIGGVEGKMEYDEHLSARRLYVSGKRMATVLTTETGIQSVLNRVKFYLNPALGHLQQIPKSQVTPCFQYLANVEAIFRVIE